MSEKKEIKNLNNIKKIDFNKKNKIEYKFEFLSRSKFIQFCQQILDE